MPMTFEFSSEQDANAFDAAVEQRFKLESRIGIGVNTHGDPDGVVWVQVATVRVSEDCQVTLAEQQPIIDLVEEFNGEFWGPTGHHLGLDRGSDEGSAGRDRGGVIE